MFVMLLSLSALVSTALAVDSDADGCDDAYEGNNACVSVDASVAPGTVVGADSEVRPFARVGPDVTLGADVVLAERSSLGGRDTAAGNSSVGDGTVIGRRTSIGNDYTIAGDVAFSRAVTAGNGLQTGSGAAIGYGASIGDNVSIGANAVIGSLVSIGDNASVGSSAVLARSVTVDDAATPSLGSQIDGIVGPDSHLGVDVFVQSGARIRKQVTVGDGAQILSTARIGRDARIGADATIAGTVRTGAVIEAGATVEDGAMVARGALVCANATVPDSASVLSGGTWPQGGCLAPASCADILASGNSIGSGMYSIDPDGAGPVEPVDAYCDMDTAPGGWTLVWHSYTGNLEADADQRFTVPHEAVITDPTTSGSWVNLIPVADYAFVETASVLRYEYKDLSGNISGPAAHQNVTATGDFSGLFTAPSPTNYVPVVVNELHGAQRQVVSGGRIYWGNCTNYSVAMRFETYRDGSYYSAPCHTDNYGNNGHTVSDMDFSSFYDSHSRAWGTIGSNGWGAGALNHVGNIWVR